MICIELQLLLTTSVFPDWSSHSPLLSLLINPFGKDTIRVQYTFPFVMTCFYAFPS